MLGDVHHREAIRLPPPHQIKRLGRNSVQPDADLPQFRIIRTLERRVREVARSVVTMQLDGVRQPDTIVNDKQLLTTPDNFMEAIVME